MGRGCEKLQPEQLLAGPAAAAAEGHIVRLQDERFYGFEAMVGAIIDRADERLAALNRRRRESCAVPDLIVGVQ